MILDQGGKSHFPRSKSGKRATYGFRGLL